MAARENFDVRRSMLNVGCSKIRGLRGRRDARLRPAPVSVAHLGGADFAMPRANSVPFKSQIRTTSPAANSPSQARHARRQQALALSRARPVSRRHPRTTRPGDDEKTQSSVCDPATSWDGRRTACLRFPGEDFRQHVFLFARRNHQRNAGTHGDFGRLNFRCHAADGGFAVRAASGFSIVESIFSMTEIGFRIGLAEIFDDTVHGRQNDEQIAGSNDATSADKVRCRRT